MPDGGMEFIGEQGDCIKRSGRVKIRLRLKQKNVEDISIAGEAVTILDSTLNI
jgi:predicted PhzF superfamily epimerase YddE/YHI9